MRYLLLLILASCTQLESKSFNRTMKINSSVPEEYRAAIIEAADIWNKHKGCTAIEVSSELDTSLGASKDGINTIYWLDSWEDNKVYEQARTTIYFQGSNIYEADVKINAKNFVYSDGAKPEHVDLVSLMVHEFGHCLGIGHSNDIDSVMRPSLSSNKERRVPSTEDLEKLRCL